MQDENNMNQGTDNLETPGHLLTVLRGRMQMFEYMQDFTNQSEEWDRMLEYLQEYLDDFKTKILEEIEEKLWLPCCHTSGMHDPVHF